jgi:mRNA-degrading endonuclease RelE of RelBE toxin-antitoxin system
MIDPKKQRSIFWDFQDGQIAESRLDEEEISYEKYREARGAKGICAPLIHIAQSVQSDLKGLDDTALRKLDEGLLELANNPSPTGSQPKHLRWFLDNLRMVRIADYPVFYTVKGRTASLRVLRVGISEKVGRQETLSRGFRIRADSGTHKARKSRRGEPPSRKTDLFIAYAGETADELFSYPAKNQEDALVQAFREGIQQKVLIEGNLALSDEERIVLAVTALQQEVNNGGFDQFLRNPSREFAPVIADSLSRIGCKKAAKITARALNSLGLPILTVSRIDAALMTTSKERDQELQQCDELFYKLRGSLAMRLYSFIAANKGRIVFP